MIIISIISIVIYMVAILMISTNTYEFKKEQKIKIILIGIIVTFVLTILICQMSSSSIKVDANYLKIAKKAAILLFAPINAILFLPYIGNVLNQYKSERLNEKQLKKRIIIIFIIVIIMIAFEIGYIKNFEIGLMKSVI